jgi:hypothetical protein
MSYYSPVGTFSYFLSIHFSCHFTPVTFLYVPVVFEGEESISDLFLVQYMLFPSHS